MSHFFLVISGVLAVANFFAVVKKWKRLEYLAKPGTIIALLIWIVVNGGLQGSMIWFALGATFSLFGDVFLMLPQERFIAGLIAFLIAQVFYTIGFNIEGIELNIAILILIVVLTLMSYQITRRIFEGLISRDRGNLRIPVFSYAAVISLMLLSALSTFARPEWRFSEAILSSAGALLFVLSDSLLSWEKFVAPISDGRIIGIAAYHLGQFGIALGAGFHFLGK